MDIFALIDKHPRAPLLSGPTPVEHLARLSRQLGSTWAKIFRLARPSGSRAGDTPPAITVVPDAVALAA